MVKVHLYQGRKTMYVYVTSINKKNKNKYFQKFCVVVLRCSIWKLNTLVVKVE